MNYYTLDVSGMFRDNKQIHTRRLKPLKHVLNPTQYQFILWVTNQKWYMDFLRPNIHSESQIIKLQHQITNKLWSKR